MVAENLVAENPYANVGSSIGGSVVVSISVRTPFRDVSFLSSGFLSLQLTTSSCETPTTHTTLSAPLLLPSHHLAIETNSIEHETPKPVRKRTSPEAEIPKNIFGAL
jgi:hypothetical protein